jgi:DNA-binding XRE family transcriptional regulator
MLEPTKKPRTEEVIEIRAKGPLTKKDRAIKALEKLGFIEVEDSVPWEECFPEYTEEKRPGIILRAARGREDLTQKELAKLTGIPQHHISEMENSKRSIGKERARKLAKALNTDYRLFL